MTDISPSPSHTGVGIKCTACSTDLRGSASGCHDLHLHGPYTLPFSLQAQRARTALLQEVVGLMAAAGVDAFIGNTSEELAMANLASLPTMAVPLGTQPLKDAPDSPRKRPMSLGVFGSPQSDSTVRHLLCTPSPCIMEVHSVSTALHAATSVMPWQVMVSEPAH